MKRRSYDTAHRQMRRSMAMLWVAMLAVHSSAYAVVGNNAYASDGKSQISMTFQRCAVGSHKACVVDGDTIWFEDEKIRIADIDTPEVSEPKCSSELALGNRATDRMLELLNDGPFEFKTWPGRDTDRYGRKLRVLIRDGSSLGDVMVSEGLARTWSGRREPWC